LSTSTQERVAPELVGTWDIDPTHSMVGFSVRHAMVATVRGGFDAFAGSISIGEDLSDSTVEVTIDAASIDTRSEDRDRHLRSADFFDVENHPTITFRGTGVEPAGEGRYRVRGDLTIRGVTRPVDLDVAFNGTTIDGYGNLRGGIEASTTISRKDWGLNWNMALEAGGVLVSDRIKISLDVAAVKRAAAVSAA
jgi:polyisoprenoid-binding protein YceI